MMTKEEYFTLLNYERNMSPTVRKTFEQLIEEYFDPKPYKFEELKVSMPIYNKELNHDGLITNIKNNEFGKQIEYIWVDKSGYAIRELVKFNTSSFYPPNKVKQGKQQ